MTEYLIAFIRAQLDDDERVALEATPGPWSATPSTDAPPQEEGREGIEPVDAEHIARWDPARVLAEIEAKRRILDDYDIVASAIRHVDDVDGNQLLYARRDARMSDIRWLAQPYADRDGYREDWRP